jgi:outer membrane protein assembly factor BamB
MLQRWTVRLWPVLLLAAATCAQSPRVDQGNLWTRFRGPNGQGRAETTGIPVEWAPSDYRWRTTLPGEGHSSPVVWGNKLFITCSNKDIPEGTVLALDATTGRILWQKTYPLTRYTMNSVNSYAASTPAVDAEQVYILWPTADELTLAALDLDGNQRWIRTFGPIHSNHGPCVSPILYDDLVIFAQEQRENDRGLHSRWLAVDKATGEIRWQLPRGNAKISHITPCVFTDASGADQLIFSSLAHGVTGVDPKTGRLLWEISGLFDVRTIGSPVIAGDYVVATCGAGGSGTVMVVVQPGTDSRQARLVHKIESRLVSFVPTPIVVDGRLYTFHDQGTISCWDVEKGEPIWSRRHAGRFHGSPIAIGDHLYCMTTEGQVVVLRAGDEYEVVAANPLGEKSEATPAVANDRLYLRTLTSVICVAGRGA